MAYKRKYNTAADALDVAGGVAPFAGSALGGLAGGLVAGPAGIVPGMQIGGAIGGAAGVGASAGAGALRGIDDEEELQRQNLMNALNVLLGEYL